MDEAPTHPAEPHFEAFPFGYGEDVQERLQDEEQTRTLVDHLTATVGEHVPRGLRIAHDLDHRAAEVSSPSEREDRVAVARHLTQERTPLCLIVSQPAVKACADERALGGGDHDGSKSVIAGVALEHVVRAARVRVHRLLGQVREGARPEMQLVERAAPNGDDRVVVLGPRRIPDRQEQVAAAQAAHEAERKLERQDLANELAHRPYPHGPLVCEHEFRRRPQLVPARVGHADRHRARVQHEAQELEPGAEADAELLRRQGPAEGLDGGHDPGHPRVVGHRAYRASEVVEVHDQGRHEPASPQHLSRHRRELRERVGRGAEAEGEAVVHVVHALEVEADRCAKALVGLSSRISAKQIEGPQRVVGGQLFDKVLQALHLERQLLEQLVQDTAVLDLKQKRRAVATRPPRA